MAAELFATRADSVGQHVRTEAARGIARGVAAIDTFLQKKVRTGRCARQQAKVEAEKLKAKRADQMETTPKSSQARKAKISKAMTGTATRRSAEPPRDQETRGARGHSQCTAS